MMRFVDLGTQIGPLCEPGEWPREFTFYDTITDRFLILAGEQVWDGTNLLHSPESGILLVGVTGWLLLFLVLFSGFGYLCFRTKQVGSGYWNITPFRMASNCDGWPGTQAWMGRQIEISSLPESIPGIKISNASNFDNSIPVQNQPTFKTRGWIMLLCGLLCLSVGMFCVTMLSYIEGHEFGWRRFIYAFGLGVGLVIASYFLIIHGLMMVDPLLSLQQPERIQYSGSIQVQEAVSRMGIPRTYEIRSEA